MLPSETRVLMLSTDASALVPGSPTQQRLAAYAERLKALTVLVIGAKGETLRQGPLTVEAVPSARLFRPLAASNAVRAKLDAEEFDVVSAQDPFETGRGALKGIRRSRAPQTPLQVQVHTDFLSPWFARTSFKNALRVRIADFVLPQSAGIRVVSERIKKSLVARYGDRIPEPTVIPIAVSVPKDDAPAKKAQTFTFIATGRFEAEKRMGDILSAFALVRKKRADVALIMLGDGREKSALRERAHALRIEDAVSWLGWRTDAPELMRDADVFVQASAYEGYGLTLIEAALARLPIITTDVGIVGDVLKPEKETLVVPVGDVQALAQAMERVMEDRELRAKLGSEASHTARNHLMGSMAQPDEIAEDLAHAASRAAQTLDNASATAS